VPLAKKPGQKFVAATPDNAVNKTYPLSRFLYVYVNKAPNKSLSPMEAEFVKMVLSKQGQEIVIKDGYIPLPSKVVSKALKALAL
jgi:phosphate transport system substrate-binding protein